MIDWAAILLETTLQNSACEVLSTNFGLGNFSRRPAAKPFRDGLGRPCNGGVNTLLLCVSTPGARREGKSACWRPCVTSSCLLTSRNWPTAIYARASFGSISTTWSSWYAKTRPRSSSPAMLTFIRIFYLFSIPPPIFSRTAALVHKKRETCYRWSAGATDCTNARISASNFRVRSA